MTEKEAQHELHQYVYSFFRYADKKDIAGIKLKLKNDDDLPKNSEYLPHYLAHIAQAKDDRWRAAILRLVDDHKGVSRFVESIYHSLPDKFHKDLNRMSGGDFPVDHRSKAWTLKKTYKKWVGKLKRKTVRHTKKEDLCVGDTSICKGHLGISRKYMPQFNSPAEIRQFTRFVKKAYGIRSYKTQKAAKDMKSSQREISKKRVQGLIDDNIINKMRVPILISGDDYVIDGHHRWAAYMLKAPEKKMPVVVIDAPIKDVLGIAVAWGAKHQDF